MATYKFSFMEAGIYRQEKAMTKLEAIREMETSCDKCYYRFNCNKRWCKIYKAHQERLDYLEFKRIEALKPKKSEEDYIVKVRKYETTSEASKKKHALSLLTKVTKKLAKGKVSFELELAIDDASALIGVDDYKTAIGILNNVKLKNLANKLSEILL